MASRLALAFCRSICCDASSSVAAEAHGRGPVWENYQATSRSWTLPDGAEGTDASPVLACTSLDVRGGHVGDVVAEVHVLSGHLHIPRERGARRRLYSLRHQR